MVVRKLDLERCIDGVSALHYPARPVVSGEAVNVCAQNVCFVVWVELCAEFGFHLMLNLLKGIICDSTRPQSLHSLTHASLATSRPKKAVQSRQGVKWCLVRRQRRCLMVLGFDVFMQEKFPRVAWMIGALRVAVNGSEFCSI